MKTFQYLKQELRETQDFASPQI